MIYIYICTLNIMRSSVSLFFFSSRRRHTRWPRDWSSDVCSSDLTGVLVGHWSHPVAMTGCTVILAPDGAVGGVDVRGGAPGTLNTDALRSGTSIPTVNGVLLTGGSAFGLEAAFGVTRYLEEQGKGFAIGPVRVPSVVGAVIFDLLVGDPRV